MPRTPSGRSKGRAEHLLEKGVTDPGSVRGQRWKTGKAAFDGSTESVIGDDRSVIDRVPNETIAKALPALAVQIRRLGR